MRGRATATGTATVILGGVLLLGCFPATVYYRQLLPPPHAMTPHEVEEVEVLVVTPPAAPHVDVGLLQVTTGDDVLITSVDNQTYSRYARPSMQGSCIVYKRSPA